MKSTRLTRITGQLPILIDPYNGDLLRSTKGLCFLIWFSLLDFRAKNTGDANSLLISKQMLNECSTIVERTLDSRSETVRQSFDAIIVGNAYNVTYALLEISASCRVQAG